MPYPSPLGIFVAENYPDLPVLQEELTGWKIKILIHANYRVVSNVKRSAAVTIWLY